MATWVAERFEPLQELSAADSALARQRLTEAPASGTRDAIAAMLAGVR
ncbi:hypothetical protein [Xanthomonas translucens]